MKFPYKFSLAFHIHVLVSINYYFNYLKNLLQECQLNRDTNDAELQERLIATLRHNAHMGPRRAKHPHFIVYHYAAPVSYLITGLVDKNKVCVHSSNTKKQYLTTVGQCHP